MDSELTAETERVSITGSTLTISRIVLEDRGYYACRALFPSGTTEARAFLNILNRLFHGDFFDGISGSQYQTTAKVSRATATRHLKH